MKKEDLLKEREYLLQFAETPEEFEEHCKKIEDTVLEDNKALFKRGLAATIFLFIGYAAICVLFEVFSDAKEAIPILAALVCVSAAMSCLTRIWALLPLTKEKYAMWHAMDGINAITGCQIQARLKEIDQELEALE